MNKSRIKKLNADIDNILVKEAKRLAKLDTTKLVLSDLSTHFKQKKTWPLSYHAYQEYSQISRAIFDKLLQIKKYKVVYRNGTLLIVKNKAK